MAPSKIVRQIRGRIGKQIINFRFNVLRIRPAKAQKPISSHAMPPDHRSWTPSLQLKGTFVFGYHKDPWRVAICRFARATQEREHSSHRGFSHLRDSSRSGTVRMNSSRSRFKASNSRCIFFSLCSAAIISGTVTRPRFCCQRISTAQQGGHQ